MAVIVLADAYIGQMMEPVKLPDVVRPSKRVDWAVYGDRESRGNLINSILMNTKLLEAHNLHLQNKYSQLADIASWEEMETEDADILFVAFGITSRICHSAVTELRKQNVRAGLFRPKSLFPFPEKRMRALGESAEIIAVAELNNGMMAEDIERMCKGGSRFVRYNWVGGRVPSTRELVQKVTGDLHAQAR
jgi:pyruvate/2-oxoacid:ferredoxin oxidoreductase alpha subunit